MTLNIPSCSLRFAAVNAAPIRRIAAVALAAALLVAACTDTGSTSTTVEPSTTTLPPTTLAPATTATTTTTTLPLRTIEVSGDLPEGLATSLAATFSWMADDRNEAPPIPEGLVAPLLEMDLDVPGTVEVEASVAELETGSVAIVVSASGNVFAAADEGTGWQIVGAAPVGGGGWFGGEPRRVLVLGSDARPGQIQQRFRADSVHLLTARASDGRGTILGFPRDSYVASPYGSMKLSSVMAGRGPDVITDVVREEFGIPIEGYVVTGFVGFEGLLGALGNLPIDLPRSIPAQPWWPAFRSGEQTLTPDRVLDYSRTRKGVPGGDFARSANQGVVILAMLRLIQTKDVLSAPLFLSIMQTHTWTDLSPSALIQLAASAFILDPDLVENVVLPGKLGTAGGGSVVFLGDDAEAMIADVVDDGVLSEEVDQ
jgi:LCP family protein required for cell wall assembly